MKLVYKLLSNVANALLVEPSPYLTDLKARAYTRYGPPF